MGNTLRNFTSETSLCISLSNQYEAGSLKRRLLAIAVTALLLTIPILLTLIPRASADTDTPVSIAAFGTPVTQDFDALASSGTSSTTPAGWGFAESGTNADTTYAAGTGSSNAGNTYSFGAADSSERAFGGLRSGSLIPIVGASFVNNTGGTINSLEISYTGEQWRAGVTNRGAADRLDFQISTNATSLIAGTYANHDDLDFSSPNTMATAGALDGNAGQNRTLVSSTISGLSIPNGATFFIRWIDFDISSSDDGLAIDDFSLTANGTLGDTAPEVSSTSPADSALNVAKDTNINITFTENVDVAGEWFQISCPTSGLRQVGDTVVSGGPLTFTIDPNTDFVHSELCTVTVFATQVTDQDTDDPPDNMAANFIFSFTIADPPPPVADFVIINELDSDTPGTDTAEFVELYDGGVGNTSLDGLVVVFYNGSNDLSYAAFDLDGFSTNANGYFLLGNAALPGIDLVFANNFLQNGQDAVAMFAANSSDFPNGTAVTTTNLIDAVVYDTNDSDDPGLLILLNSSQPQVNENGGGDGANHSIQRCPNGSGGARNTSTYLARTPTPGTENDCPPPPPPPVVAAIHEIQGPGASSPFVGQNVITSGIVTARKSNGFFMQTPDDSVDADPATSEGIFVFTSSIPAVAIGDAVTVEAGVVEFFNLTELESPTITINSNGNSLPTPIVLTTTILDPAGTLDQLERFESMRVHADSLTAIAPTNNFGEIFTVITGVPRPFREPGVEISFALPPGSPCCVPRFDQNPERLMVDTDGQIGSTSISVTSGVTLTNVTGPLDFTFDDYKILPDTPPLNSANSSAIAVPEPGADEFTIASFNMQQFSGASLGGRLDKASLAIRNVMRFPDIIGVQEVDALATLQAVATKLNSDTIAGGGADPGYQAYLEEGNDIGGIDVGFLVKTSKVNVIDVTQYGKDATFIDPNTGNPAILNDRPPLVLRGTVNPPAGPAFPVTVIVNHLRSLIDINDVGPTGNRVRVKRRAQAEFLAELIQSFQTGENVVSIGDYNAFHINDGYVDSMRTIKGMPTHPDNVVLPSSDLVNPDLKNLVWTLPEAERYSFVFQGNTQAIDHVLVDEEMLARNTRLAFARNNADFPLSFGSESTRPERVSDHDMPVAYFNFPSANLSITKTAAPDPVVTGSSLSYTITVTNNGPDAAENVALSDEIPANTTFASLTAPAGWDCTTPNEGETGTVNCTTTSLASDAPASFTLVVEVDCATLDDTTISNTASVSADTADPDTDNNSHTVEVTASNPAPVITSEAVDKPILWPPNHQMVNVNVSYDVSDNCGLVECVLTVTSNEPVLGPGSGNTTPDWQVIDANNVLIRAERSGQGNGRIYTITITCTDSSGNSSSKTVSVKVPLSGG